MRFLVGLIGAFVPFLMAQAGPLSHPPLRQAPPPAQRAMAKGPAYHVDAARGADSGDGSAAKPWKSLKHALGQLKAGDTLYLRGGTYYEPAVVRLVGTADAPITIRSYPGEQAILDGGLREFFEAPAEAWEPWPMGSAGEFRSRRAYPNLRDVMGAFGDSMIGLHTYHHAQDLRADNEFWELADPAKPKESDIKPLWCGPGLWYDAASGHIHVRLSHTHLPDRPNYRGETDPRRLPLVIAPFRAVPLQVDGARHVRFQDLVIRGGGYDTCVLEQSTGVEFDNVTIWCGTYGLRLMGVRHLRMTHCGVYGSIPPWCYRADTSLRTYPGRPQRDITRFGTHALLVPECGREFSVFYLPQNDDWEIAHCDFCDGHDGVYLGGVCVQFHHNRLSGFQDDGIYLSPMYRRHPSRRAELRIEANEFSACLTALAFGGPEEVNPDQVYIYRNIFDLRAPVPTGRPRSREGTSTLSTGKPIGDHGSPPWSAMNIYHNTFVVAERGRSADLSLLGGADPQRPRRLFNNILLHLGGLPAYAGPAADSGGEEDANLYWGPNAPKSFFDRYRKSPAYGASKKVYPPGFGTHSLLADPLFRKAVADPAEVNDYRLSKKSPAIDAGIDLPADWPDPLRAVDWGKPDLGAVPLGGEAPRTGRK